MERVPDRQGLTPGFEVPALSLVVDNAAAQVTVSLCDEGAAGKNGRVSLRQPVLVIRGNHDRWVAGPEPVRMGPSDRYA